MAVARDFFLRSLYPVFLPTVWARFRDLDGETWNVASNDFDFNSIECNFVESDDTINKVDVFDGLFADAFDLCGDLRILAFDFSLAVVDRALINSNGTSLPSAISASAANLQPFELGLRSRA